jgi:leader peptidase (prepilin peptidase) / N-methyltransferase
VYPVLFGLLGLIFGSFCNAYIYRYSSGESVWRGRSHCPDCHHELKTTDLIPLFSFLLVRGRCRYCGRPISAQYPLVEAGTAVLFIGVALFVGPFHATAGYLIPLAIYLYLAIVAVVVTVIDLKIQIIPDRVILPAVIAVVILHLAQVIYGTLSLRGSLLMLCTAFGAAGLLWLVAEISQRIVGKEAMGGGDIKLLFLIGLLVGWPAIVLAILIAFWTGAVVGILLIAFGGRNLADRIPFGPYLLIGAIVGLVWGKQLLARYIGLS